MSPNDPSPDSSPESILASYWLGVCRGLEAAQALAACPSEELDWVLAYYPILSLPEFPDAIRALATLIEDTDAQEAFEVRAIDLSRFHDVLRREAPQGLASLYQDCAIELVQDYRQDRRVNVRLRWTPLSRPKNGDPSLLSVRPS